MDISAVGSLVGALGLGSVVGQYLASGGQRRETRAEVLKALEDAESARWVTSVDTRSFRDAIRQLEVTALIARLPQSLIDHYRVVAWAAFWMSGESWEQSGGDPEFGGGIDSKLADLVREAARDVAKAAWAPLSPRLRIMRSVKMRERKIDELIETGLKTEGHSSGKGIALGLKRARDHHGR